MIDCGTTSCILGLTTVMIYCCVCNIYLSSRCKLQPYLNTSVGILSTQRVTLDQNKLFLKCRCLLVSGGGTFSGQCLVVASFIVALGGN